MTRFPSVRVSADVIFRDLDGEAVLLDFNSGHYFGLHGMPPDTLGTVSLCCADRSEVW